MRLAAHHWYEISVKALVSPTVPHFEASWQGRIYSGVKFKRVDLQLHEQHRPETPQTACQSRVNHTVRVVNNTCLLSLRHVSTYTASPRLAPTLPPAAVCFSRPPPISASDPRFCLRRSGPPPPPQTAPWSPWHRTRWSDKACGTRSSRAPPLFWFTVRSRAPRRVHFPGVVVQTSVCGHVFWRLFNETQEENVSMSLQSFNNTIIHVYNVCTIKAKEGIKCDKQIHNQNIPT